MIDTEELEFDKKYVIGYTKLGKNPINFKVMYKKTSSYIGIEKFVILKSDLVELELCFNTERSDYIEKNINLDSYSYYITEKSRITEEFPMGWKNIVIF